MVKLWNGFVSCFIMLEWSLRFAQYTSMSGNGPLQCTILLCIGMVSIIDALSRNIIDLHHFTSASRITYTYVDN